MLITSLLLTTLAIHWLFGRWLSRHLQEMYLTYGKASKMLRQTIWLSRLGFTPSYTEHSTVTNKDITDNTFLSRDLRRQKTP